MSLSLKMSFSLKLLLFSLYLIGTKPTQEFCQSPLLFSYKNPRGPNGLTLPIARWSNSPVCPQLANNSKTCCSEETFQSFPLKIEQFLNETNQRLLTLNKNLLRGEHVRGQIYTLVEMINDGLLSLSSQIGGNDFFDSLQDVVSVAGDPLNEIYDYRHYPLDETRFFPLNKTKVNQSEFMKLFKPFFTKIFTVIPNTGYEGVFESYRKERANCVNFLLKLQSKLMCAACDFLASEIYEVSGVLNVKSSVCGNITSFCHKYLILDEEMSRLEALESLQKRLEAVNIFTTMIVSKIESAKNIEDKIQKKSEAISLFSEVFKFYSPPDCHCKVIEMPYRKVYSACNNTERPCFPLCQKVLSRFGIVFENLLGLGENVNGDARILEEGYSVVFTETGYDFLAGSSGLEDISMVERIPTVIGSQNQGSSSLILSMLLSILINLVCMMW